MQLIHLKNNFIKPLLPVYGQGESEHFFYMLTEAYLNYSKTDVALQFNEVVQEQKLELFEVAKQRLLTNEPIQYIIGSAYFYGNTFAVNQHTLIPRPETEELVDWIIKDNKKDSPSILDIGTGSGCIAISLSQKLTESKVSAIDISEEALKIAKQNAQDINAQVNFVQQDILQMSSLFAEFDIIVSNPPYVRELEKEVMHSNVLDYEPDLALFVSDSDPLIFYHKIAALFFAQAKKEAVLYFEINEYLGSKLVMDMKKMGFKSVELRMDFREKDRMLKATIK